MPTPWIVIENLVISRIGSLKADSEADAEINYQVVPKTNNEMGDAAFNRSAIRDEILNVTVEVVAAICRNEGDTRRIAFRQAAIIPHRGGVPSSMGPYGRVMDVDSFRSMVPRSANEVTERAENADGFWSHPVYYYAIDGVTMYHTVEHVSLEYFNYDRPATTYAALDALFSTDGTFCPLGDEFAVVIADGAAGRLCMKAGSFVSEGAAFLQAYYAALKERGVSVQPFEFQPQPAA